MKATLAWSLAIAAAIGATVLIFLVLPDPQEEFPLIDHIPGDAVAYAGFEDYRQLDGFPDSLAGDVLEQLKDAESHLAGPVAVYLDGEREWVFLARLTRTARIFAGGEVVDGAAVVAQTPEALERHRTRTGHLSAREEFRTLNAPLFVDLEALRLPGRLRDFSAAGFEFDPGPPLLLRGRALYRGGVFRLYVEHYLHAQPVASPPPNAGLAATFIEHFPRLWDEITHDLSPANRERLRRETYVLDREFLERKGVRSFLAKLGPACGLSLVPTEHDLPALLGWIDVPDPETRKTLTQMLHRAATDIEQHYRNQGEAPPFELTVDGDLWRFRILGQEAWRLGPAFSPAYTFREGRLVFTTCDSTLDAFKEPGPAGGHAQLTLRVTDLIAAFRALAPLQTDLEFTEDAERQADVLFRKLYGPAGLTALRRSIPDASTRAKFLERQRAQLTAQALQNISATDRYKEKLTGRRADLDALGTRLGGLDRLTLQGTFAEEGLQLEIRAHLKE